MSDLLFCPFCGGEAETLTAESMYGGYLFGIMCNDCRSRGDVYDTEAEAIAAWNSRADYHGYEQAAIEAWESIKAWNSRAERTCEPKWTLQGKTQTQEFWCCECGNCGYEFGVEDRSTFPFKITIDEVDVPNFCPECGAKQKVVS